MRLNYKDQTNRKNYQKLQIKYLWYKYLLYNENISVNFRFKIMLKFQTLKYLGLKTKIKNRCMYSSKARGTSRISNLAQASFKNYWANGEVSGFRKASW